MARKKKQPSFWEDAYDQCIVLAEHLEPLIELLQKNGQRNLASHLLTIFKGIPEAVAISTPEDILNRIGERIAAQQQAEMQAYIEKLLAEMPEDPEAPAELKALVADLKASGEAPQDAGLHTLSLEDFGLPA